MRKEIMQIIPQAPVGEGRIDMSLRSRYNYGVKAWENDRRGLRMSDKEEAEYQLKRKEMRDHVRKLEKEHKRSTL